jgi:hypothetical protein
VANLTKGLEQNFQGLKLDNGQKLRKGAQGDQVKALQGMLNAGGGKLDVDGRMGRHTVGAVRDFQAKHGLQVDGVVGEKTQAKLNELAASQNGPAPQPPAAATPPPVPKPKPTGEVKPAGEIYGPPAPAGSAAENFNKLAEGRQGDRVGSLERLGGTQEVRFLNGNKGPVYTKTDLDVCTDGSGKSHGDRHHLNHTASRYNRGKGDYLNADKTSYLVLPPQAFKKLGVSGAQTGDLAMLKYGDRMVPAIIGEVGPPDKMGEASISAVRELTGNSNVSPNHGRIPGGVETIIFPGSGKGRTWTKENSSPEALRPLVEGLMQQQLQNG